MIFQSLTAQYGHLLLEQLCGEAARGESSHQNALLPKAADRSRLVSWPEDVTPVLEVEAAGSEALRGGWLFIPHGTVEPKSWLVFKERRDDKRRGIVFSWSLQLWTNLSEAAFVTECCRCFVGREINSDALGEVASRLLQGRTRRHDVIRTLMTSEEAALRGRFLVIPYPSPLVTAVVPTEGKDGMLAVLRFNA